MGELLEVAKEAALEAGAIQKEYYGTLLHVDEARRNDVKLEVDRLCEETIRKTIHQAFPDHALLGEEGGLVEGTSDYLWIADPLDGTVNFFYGIPYFCTSVACWRRRSARLENVEKKEGPRSLQSVGEPIVGVVYMPLLEECFIAEAGRGATLQGEAIHASTVGSLEEAILETGFGSREEDIRYMLRLSRDLAPHVRKIRCLGAAAYDLANVACGRLTAFCERGLRLWDIAAGAILVHEAGGVFDAIEYEPGRWDVIACAKGIYEALLSRVRGSNVSGS